MIKVEKANGTGPHELRKLYKLSTGDRLTAIDFYENGLGKEAPSLKNYKTVDAKVELNRIFNFKCAYCESHVKHVGDLEIEHWRPKKKSNWR